MVALAVLLAAGRLNGLIRGPPEGMGEEMGFTGMTDKKTAQLPPLQHVESVLAEVGRWEGRGKP